LPTTIAYESLGSAPALPSVTDADAPPSAIQPDPAAFARRLAAQLTIIVPAYNEAASIADTVRSIQAQTAPVFEVLVVDDGSTDDTGAIAEACGARVVRPPTGTGSKAGAQTYALAFVETEYVMAIDADTTLAPDAIEKLLPAFADPEVVAACGFVIPRHVQTVWERGRFVEYLLAFSFYKPIQDFYEKPLIASGCFSAYRTAVLRETGSWSTRTMAEDMDLTWSFYEAGHKVRFVPAAVCYPIEPHDFGFLSKQLRRWSHGFVQNVRLHWRGLVGVPYLRLAVAVALWDATLASVTYLFLLPLLAIALTMPTLLIGYVLDAPALLVPLVIVAGKSGRLREALASVPAFFVLRTVNAVFLLEALCKELILRRPLLVYEKGH
jgi:cellulose synthase/poly-beta-1,6-N-acetylglucosamine synthase-like glycosyltransferase